jgi:phosphodiesterase/alkaline phosphatase D-like protein
MDWVRTRLVLIAACLCWLLVSLYGMMGASAVQQPATPAAQTETPSDNILVYVGPIPQQITQSSAEILWITSVPTEGVLRYGTSPQKETWSKNISVTREHAITIGDLEPATTYYFSILRPDQTERAYGHFTTREKSYQQKQQIWITNGPMIGYLTSYQARITWATNRLSTSFVRYGTDPGKLDHSARGPTSTKLHAVMLRNLRPHTKYFFEVHSKVVQGKWAPTTSAIFPFLTPAPGGQAPYGAMQP